MSDAVLDEKLKQLALSNWEEFIRIVGKDSILVGKARLLRKDGKTYKQISLKLKLTESQVKYACKNIEDKN